MIRSIIRYINPKVFQLAEDAESAHMMLDQLNVPRASSCGQTFSLYGRIDEYVSSKLRKPIGDLTTAKDN